MKAFLDMDGVLANFNKGIHQAHGREDVYNKTSSLGVFDIETLWGITPEEFWIPHNYQGFWLGLEKMPEADGIMKAAVATFGEENVAILTFPSESIWSVSEKREWIKKNYPTFSKRMIFGSAKEFMASSERVLIDDRDKNIEDFQNAGGHTVIVPRAWNSEYGSRHRTLESVKEQLFPYGGRK